MPHATVSPRQRARAKRFRREMTRAENLLWRYLKAHHIEDLGFRRQVPMGRYIADFICYSAKVIVELDGESHDFESRIEHDGARDAWFSSQGFVVLRFTNDDVMKNLDGVVAHIREMAASRIATPPSLSLPHKGGGNSRTNILPVAKPRTAQPARRAQGNAP